VEQRDNLLRITPFWEKSTSLSESFMEIKQIPNTTIEEMEQMVINSTDFSRYYDTFHNQPTADSPFASFTLYDGFDGNNIVTNIYIKDNKNEGVFVVTTQHTIEATEGIGVRFRASLKTLEVLDLENAIIKN